MHVLLAAQALLDRTRAIDFLAPLALRLYLVPIFWIAGTNKISGFDNTVAWFGNPDWGLGLPFPWLMAFMATSAEVVGAIGLLLGLAVRWLAIPLMATMIMAALAVHWENGWQAVADPTFCLFNCESAQAAAERLAMAKSLLREHGNYDWLTAEGNFVVLNNGIEWAATYFVMLLVLFFYGAGRFVSLDYWIARRFRGRA